MKTIALAGNPNSGKTTLFNALTGANQYVGNWPGVTVEKKEGKLKGYKDITITDLPGIYSLSPYTLEEVIARDYLLEAQPDAILNIIDGTNLERNLYLTTQLLEIGIPVVVAINMVDILEKNGDKVNKKQLKDYLGCEVVEVSALKETKIFEAMDVAVKAAEQGCMKSVHIFHKTIEDTLISIETQLVHVKDAQKRFFAIKLFERDEKICAKIKDTLNIEEMIKKVEQEMDDDSESIITNERYVFLSSIIKSCFKRNHQAAISASDKVDRIVTNRWLALPIFAGIMYIVYYISVTVFGGPVTDWTVETLFGEIISPAINDILVNIDVASWLQSLVIDGIVAGVGSVLGFIPQLLVLFLFLASLEACGYMARVAFIMDRFFRKFGLSGKSFIPMLIGTGCGVPGVMASRTIENVHDRRMTIMTTTFVPCSAKLAIIALIAGAMFRGASWVAPSAYFVGIGAIIVSGIILKKTVLFSGDPAPFIMELPAYHMPTIKNVMRSMWERSYSFIKKAGTIILLSTIFVWFSSSFGFVDGQFGMVENMSGSILETLGNWISWIFRPLGFGDWKATVATITGLVAKENVVGTFGILYGFSEVAEDGMEIWGTLASSYTTIAAYSFLVFNLLCAPCFAAIGAIRREMNDRMWTLFSILYQCVFAYAISFCMFQIANWMITSEFTVITIVAIGMVMVFVYFLFKKAPAHKGIK